MATKEIKKIISDQLRVEHSRRNTEIIREYVGTDPEKMKALIDIIMGDDLQLHQRGSYALNIIGEVRPEMVHPHLTKLFKLLPDPPHESFSRAIVRIYGKNAVPKKWQGRFVDLCFGYLENPKCPVATRIFSISVLMNIARQERDLLPELKLIILEHYEHGTTGFKSRAKRTLKEIDKLAAANS